MTSRVLRGIPAAPGLAEGPARVRRAEAIAVPRTGGAAPEIERDRLAEARAAAARELRTLRDRVARGAGASEAAIFDAHAMLLDDPALRAAVEGSLARGLNAEAAWHDAVERFAAQLEALPDPSFRARAADVRDVGRRVLRHLLGRAAEERGPVAPAVIVAEDLAPSEVAALDRAWALALCLARGGPTSHAAILARAWRIPAVVGLGDAIDAVADGDLLLVDGNRGEVIVRPTAEARTAFRDLAARTSGRGAGHVGPLASDQPAVPRGGRPVLVEANAGSVAEVEEAARAGADGIGLLRTEFLFVGRREPPGEDEQAEAYRAALAAMGGRPVVVRTLDAGGDKPLPYLPVGPETNPFLGRRGIRLLLDHPEVLLTQCRALLRAAASGELRVMFPMVATVEELRRARALFEQARATLPAPSPAVPVGMMVEVPSAVWMADRFAREAAFLSIGTNDLAQYTMAADRGHPRLAHLQDGCHPAVLRQIHRVVEAGHAAGIPVAVCGELAGDPDAVPLLVGLGVDALSVAAASVGAVKALVGGWTAADAAAAARDALDLDAAEAVRALVRSRAPREPQREALLPLLPAGAIRVGVEAGDWREAVAAAGAALADSGAADPTYTAEMTAAIEQMGPYMVIAPGIALPHARPSPAVRRAGLAVVTLARPVAFGHPQNDPVRLVVALAAPDNRSHTRALAALARLLADERAREALLRARSAEEIRAVVEAYPLEP